MKIRVFSRCMVVLACALAFGASNAETIYKREQNGVTTYSTKPGTDAVVVKLPELSVIPGHTQSSPSMPSLPSPSFMPGNNNNLLPPPPPSLGVKPSLIQPSAPVTRAPSRDEVQAQLSKARAELAAQEEVRFGEEKNYQKKLDRLKPFQNKVDDLTKALSVLPQ